MLSNSIRQRREENDDDYNDYNKKRVVIRVAIDSAIGRQTDH
jgi:hypothetical protein